MIGVPFRDVREWLVPTEDGNQPSGSLIEVVDRADRQVWASGVRREHNRGLLGKHHGQDHAERIIPIFPELRPHLESVFEQAEPFDRHRPETAFVIQRYRNANQNLRTTFTKIIRRAGLVPWEKLFPNLRVTRATELASEYPAHVAAEWLGHSTVVAQKHYWRTTGADLKKAIQTTKTGSEKAAQNPAQFQAVLNRRELQSGLCDNKKALKNCTRRLRATLYICP